MKFFSPFIMFIFLMISFYGYSGFVRLYLKIPHFSSYFFVFTSISCLVFISSFFGNMMRFVTYVIFALGLFLFVYLYVFSRRLPNNNILSVSFISFCFLSVLFFLLGLLADQNLTHYDNFSHWGLIVKNFLVTNMLPSSNSNIIAFNSYPPGSASFIYYVCKIVDSSESVMIVAQLLLILSCFYSIFTIVKTKFNSSLLLGIGCCLMILFNIKNNMLVSDLLVDFLLPIVALAIISNVIHLKNNITLCLISSIPPLAFLGVIKDSGLFYLILCLFFLIYSLVKSNSLSLNKIIRFSLVALLSSLSLFLIWKIHVAISFPNDTSKFNLLSLSPEVSKTRAEVLIIFRAFIDKIFSIKTLSTLVILISNLAAIFIVLIYYKILKFDRIKLLLKVLLLGDFLLILYSLGLLGMYVVAMPYYEAYRVAAFDRYMSSIVQFFLGVLFITIVRIFSSSKLKYSTDLLQIPIFSFFYFPNILAIFTVLTLLTSSFSNFLARKQNYSDSLPYRVEKLVGNNFTKVDDSSYLIYSPIDTGAYLRYVAKYKLFSPNVREINSFTDTDFDALLSSYDYFIIYENDEGLLKYMIDNYNFIGNVGMYKVEDIILKK